MNKQFKINKYITLKLENDNTFIYIDGKEFKQCKYLFITIPAEEKDIYDDIESIDHLICKDADDYESYPTDNLFLGEYDTKYTQFKYKITPEEEFMAHCSNLQTWVESNYDTRLLHSNLSFPILKKLTELDAPLAKTVLKEEIAKRFSSGFTPVMKYLMIEGYLNYIDLEESELLVRDFNKIDFAECGLREIPKFLFRAERVETLYLDYNNISEIPHYIQNLDDLKVLDFSFNAIDCISNSIGMLTSLEKLNLSKNKLKDLPDSFTNLKSLKILNLWGNYLTSIPNSIGSLESLENMNLSKNYLENLPISLNNLKSLKELNLSLNKFREFPEIVCQIGSLEQLNLSNNNISKLPESIIKLNNIPYLNVNQNEITEVSVNIGYLKSLTTLSISGNNISKIPESLKNLTSLKTL